MENIQPHSIWAIYNDLSRGHPKSVAILAQALFGSPLPVEALGLREDFIRTNLEIKMSQYGASAAASGSASNVASARNFYGINQGAVARRQMAAEMEFTFTKRAMSEDPVSLYQICREVKKIYSSEATEYENAVTVEQADFEMKGSSAFPVGRVSSDCTPLFAFIDPISGVSPVCLIDTFRGKLPSDPEAGFHRPMYGDTLSIHQAITVFILERNKTDYVMVFGTVILHRHMNDAAAWMSQDAAYKALTKLQTLNDMTPVSHMLRLSMNDCQHNDIGVTAGRISILRERHTKKKNADGVEWEGPVFEQVAAIYVSDQAEERVFKVQGRIQPQNMATNEEHASHAFAITLARMVPGTVNGVAKAIPQFFIMFVRNNFVNAIKQLERRVGEDLFPPLHIENVPAIRGYPVNAKFKGLGIRPSIPQHSHILSILHAYLADAMPLPDFTSDLF